MPRKARALVANTPHHIVQRGHNRDTVFHSSRDFRHYLKLLREASRPHRMALHSYCLMPNHVHLILSPGDCPSTVSDFMHDVALGFSRYANRRRQRSGSVWERRFYANPIQTDAYLLECSRYVELNPVRANMVAAPGDYCWSSFPMKTEPAAKSWLVEDPCFQEFGSCRADRCSKYAAFVNEGAPEEQVALFRKLIGAGHPIGDEHFVNTVARQTGVSFRPRGRPRKC